MQISSVGISLISREKKRDFVFVASLQSEPHYVIVQTINHCLFYLKWSAEPFEPNKLIRQRIYVRMASMGLKESPGIYLTTIEFTMCVKQAL